jgi:hypothetical protein
VVNGATESAFVWATGTHGAGAALVAVVIVAEGSPVKEPVFAVGSSGENGAITTVRCVGTALGRNM